MIAAIEGPAVAGGLELALWCDLRVVAAGRRARRVLPPLRRAARRPGHDQPAAPDRPQPGDGPDPHRRGIDGVEAERIGLVNRVTDPGEALNGAVELAHELARCRNGACATTGCRRSSSGTSTSTRRPSTRRAAARRRSRVGDGGGAHDSPPAPGATARPAAASEEVRMTASTMIEGDDAGAAPGAARCDAPLVGPRGDLPHRLARRSGSDGGSAGRRDHLRVCVVAMLTVSGIYHLPSLFSATVACCAASTTRRSSSPSPGRTPAVIALGCPGRREWCCSSLVWVAAVTGIVPCDGVVRRPDRARRRRLPRLRVVRSSSTRSPSCRR